MPKEAWHCCNVAPPLLSPWHQPDHGHLSLKKRLHFLLCLGLGLGLGLRKPQSLEGPGTATTKTCLRVAWHCPSVVPSTSFCLTSAMCWPPQPQLVLLLLLHLRLVLCLGLVLGFDLCFKKTTKPRAPGYWNFISRSCFYRYSLWLMASAR